MFRTNGLLLVGTMVSALVLAACGPAGPTPMPLSAIEVPSTVSSFDATFPSTLPWANDGTKVSDGPYQGYKIEGPAYYSFFKANLSQDAFNAFYSTKMTAAGWSQGTVDMYMTKFGDIESGQPWAKDNQVIYLVVYQNPNSHGSSYVLAIYSLTK